MPFDKDTKARMFVRCARICCLCWKQCGTNIEAAHIIDESEGGSNDEENGIPLCMDCHTEVGHYSPEHPKGNKFSSEELKARRDRLYGLVESGVLQTLIVTGGKRPQALTLDSSLTKPSKETEQVLQAAQRGDVRGQALSRKLGLLDVQSQAYVLDCLLKEYDQGESIAALAVVLSSDRLGAERTLLVTEHLLRSITLCNDCSQKVKFMELVPVQLLKTTDEGLRLAFFTEIIAIMNADKFGEVNEITPAVPKVQEAIPDELKVDYVEALLNQSDSHSWRGAPAAQQALRNLPDEVVRPALAGIKLNLSLGENARAAFVDLLSKKRGLWPADRITLFNDFITLSWRDFFHKYLDE